MFHLLLKNVSKSYHTKIHKLPVLKNINFHVDRGEFICVLGPSGCGKTTLLKLIDGLSHPDDGEIIIDDHVSSGPSQLKSMVFQDLALFPWLTATRNIQFGLESNHFKKEEVVRLTNQYLKLIKLTDYANYYPHQLSGGMQQRVALARALAYKPKILLLDEPFASLDAITRSQMQTELLCMWQKTHTTIILVTHNIEEAIFLGQRVLIMTNQVGTIKKEVIINFPQVRHISIKTSPRFTYLRRKIENLL